MIQQPVSESFDVTGCLIELFSHDCDPGQAIQDVGYKTHAAIFGSEPRIFTIARKTVSSLSFVLLS